MSQNLRIGEVAARSGCHIETIRYYERIGLLPRPSRSRSGYRAYAEADVTRLRFMVHCRELGFSLDEIRSLIALSEDPKLSCGRVDALARQHLEDIQSKQRALARLSREIKQLIDTCARGQRGTCEILASLQGPARHVATTTLIQQNRAITPHVLPR
jgi:MerR family mercuric resistance operon transcriptional regulator